MEEDALTKKTAAVLLFGKSGFIKGFPVEVKAHNFYGLSFNKSQILSALQYFESCSKPMKNGQCSDFFAVKRE